MILTKSDQASNEETQESKKKEHPQSPNTSSKKGRRMCLYNLKREKEFSWVVKCQIDHTKARCKQRSASFTVGYVGIKR